MAKDKTIIERFAETVRDVAKTATDAASEALKSERPANVEGTTAGYMPLAADGLVSDPLMVPPIAGPRQRRKRRASPKGSKKRTRKMAGTPAPKAAKKSSARKRKATDTRGRRTARKPTARKTKATMKRRAGKSRP
jgi:hypothetical protein